jgi:hypothetical protein
MTHDHDEHNALPWYKRMFRWGPRNVKWIVLAVAITFGLGFCAESEAQSFSAGLAITKLHVLPECGTPRVRGPQ